MPILGLVLALLALRADPGGPVDDPPAADAVAMGRLRARHDEAARHLADRDSPTRPAYNACDFAREALDLARAATDEGVAADATCWAARLTIYAPVQDEAIGLLEARFVRSGRIAGACWPASGGKGRGARLLERIVRENPDPAVRGVACLALAANVRFDLRERRRVEAIGPEMKGWIGAAEFERLERLDPAALVARADEWVGRAVVEFPAAFARPEVVDFLPNLAGDLGRNVEVALRRVADGHPDARIRREAASTLLLQQMELAELVADAADPRSAATLARRVRDVPGGGDRVRAVDAGRLAAEVDRRLGDPALGDLADPPEPPAILATLDRDRDAVACRELLTSLGATRAFHAGAERLLRRVAETPGEGPARVAARQALAQFLAGLAEASAQLRYAAGDDRARWVALLGAARADQVRGLDVAAISREARELARRAAAERPVDPEAGPAPEPDAAVGLAAPEIVGEDLDGKRLALGDYRGRVVLLDFWRHAIPGPRRDDYAGLRAVAERFRGRPFTLLGVNLGDDLDVLAPLVADGAVTWRFWAAPGTEDDLSFAGWDVPGVQDLCLLDHRGVLRVRFRRPPTAATLDAAIRALVAEAEARP